jgi:hypothetical protein
VIRDAAKVFAVATAAQLGSQRLGDQYGALAAGAWSLCHEHVPSAEEAAAWLAERPLAGYAEATEVPDEKNCLQTILEHQLRVDVERGVKVATVLELVRIAVQGENPSLRARRAMGGDPDAEANEITPEGAVRALGQIGVKVHEPKKEGEPRLLAISNTSKGLRRVLSDTSWELCWSTALSRMEGAIKAGPTWFPEIGTSRAVLLPMPELDDPG